MISKSFLQTGMKIAFEKNIPDKNRRSVWKWGAINGANRINREDSSRDDVASDVDSTPMWPSTTAHSTSTGLDVTNMGYTGLI